MAFTSGAVTKESPLQSPTQKATVGVAVRTGPVCVAWGVKVRVGEVVAVRVLVVVFT